MLLAARLLQGAGAAAVPVLGMAIVSARYDGAVRTTALGQVAGTAAAVSALGPLAGGLVADVAGWRAVVALPALGLLVVPALWRALPTQGTGARLDVLGAVLVAGTAAGLVLLVQSPASGVVVATAGRVLLALGVPAVAAWVRRRPEGFLPTAGRPRAGRRPQRAGGLRGAGGLVRAAHRRPRGAGRATAGRRCRSGWRWCRARSPASSRPRLAGPLLARLGPARSLVTSDDRPRRVALGVAALGAARGSAAMLVTAVDPGDASPSGSGSRRSWRPWARPCRPTCAAWRWASPRWSSSWAAGSGSAVVGGSRARSLGVDRSLLLLALLPLLGSLALVGTIRAARVTS